MENEIMKYEEVMETVGETVAEGKPVIGTGVAMLIGGVMTLAVTAGVKKLREVIANRKAKAAEAADYEDLASEEK